ncbi:CBASS cGAMP-activated phospholipase [bacterium]
MKNNKLNNIINKAKLFFSLDEKKYFKILSIDGGGVRGIFPLHIIKKIKEDFAVTFSKEFDIIAGTSIGSIIAASLALDREIQEILDIFQDEADEVFQKKHFELKGLFRSLYDTKALKKVLKNRFNNKTLADVKTKLLIPASDISKGRYVIFGSDSHDTDKYNSLKIYKAVLASCSLPIYFDPVNIGHDLFVDGGLWANNSMLVALIQALKVGVNLEDIKILSIGTGKRSIDCKLDQDKKWGALRWNLKLLGIVSGLQSSSIEDITEFLIKDNLLRINFDFDTDIRMDDVERMDDLEVIANEKYKENFEKIKDFFDIISP